MSTWDKRYIDQVKLLVEVLPVLADEPRFALKGGTAINLFEHDLPRLSVDIDLTWLPVGDFAKDSELIADSLATLGETLRSGPMRLQVQASANQGAPINRLIASRGLARVKIETSPVMRGTVHPVRSMTVRPAVEAAFGFAQMQVLHFADLYAGKLAAALSRQHPRDLFDMGPVLEQERLDVMLWQTFLIYLTCSPKPAADMLAPAEPRDFMATFTDHFQGMTAEPISAEALLATRDRLLVRMRELLDETSCRFLMSIEFERPDFDLLGMPQAATLPAIRRKLDNLGKRSDVKRAVDQRKLQDTLEHLRGSDASHRGSR